MADLFTVTAPLVIRDPQANFHIMAALFPHRQGILYFDLFWDVIEQQSSLQDAAHLVSGPLKGDGPWKVGEHVIMVLGCQGTQPELAAQFAQWQQHIIEQGYTLSSKDMLRQKAQLMGALEEPAQQHKTQQP